MGVASVIRSLLAVPQTVQGDSRRRAELLIGTATVLLLISAAVAATVSHKSTNQIVWRGVLPISIASCLAVLVLARAGRTEAAAAILTVYGALTVAIIAWPEGPGGNRMSIAIVAVCMVGGIQRPRVTVLFGLGLAAMIAGLGLAQTAGVYVPRQVSPDHPIGSSLRNLLTVGLLVIVQRRSYDRLHAQVLARERAGADAVDTSRAFNASLEQLVEERTSVLTATRHRLTGLANRLADDLTADLAGISQRLATFLARESALGAERLADVTVAGDAAARLTAMLSRLHEHARLGTAALRPARVDMDGLVRDVIHEYGRATPSAPIDWRVDTMPPAWADPTLLRTVVENLVTNAMKFSRTRQPPRIHVGFDADSGRYFIRDNGVGFDPSGVAKLFTPFRRLHRGSDFEGHGVGLANVRRIIERSQGDIQIEGQPDVGAVVFWRLPRPEGLAE